MRIGLLLPKYNTSQLAYEAIKSINKQVCLTTKDDYILFYENVSPFCEQPMCAAMTPDEMALFDGMLISTNFTNLEQCVRTINTAKKVLYLADIEWLRPNYNRSYEQNMSLLDGVRLIARSQTHKQILENYCNKPVEVVEYLDVPRIANGQTNRELQKI